MSIPIIKVISVRPLENYRLHVALSNGKIGIFDVSPYLDKGIFVELKNREYFIQVKPVFNNTGIGWARGQDLSANTIDCGLQLLNAENDEQKHLVSRSR